jgi:hypothetical protein
MCARAGGEEGKTVLEQEREDSETDEVAGEVIGFDFLEDLLENFVFQGAFAKDLECAVGGRITC